ncbi:class I SAM-dependent methyltransferase [Variovorax sp. 770b2]|uniref:class I SAM-dependent methyltransferase n=1 Tax=Variovorax sp. 770b2 TaxID=1566271 RepID=UPI0008F02E0E|nr:class I SAM-dependent methyltransferase [Variovorax sp. 770b2]SFQ04283.1 SAM-dependent methyltransferase [Variovorax sp. 770b2]
MAWNEGYVVKEAYTSGYYRRQSPVYLSAACALNGFEPVDTRKPFTYFELGSGQGFTSNVIAASNPHAQFFAADFMPEHVATGRELATAARLRNVTHLEKSFAQLAAGEVDLPGLDFITMHGVYSWINAVNRRHIVDFIARYLKPGGIVYVSYNALPGWSIAAPLQRLVLEHARVRPGSPGTQVAGAKDLIDRLSRAEALYFSSSHANPILHHRLESWAREKPTYLAHEYLNESWQALYHADVVRDMAEAKLEFAVSAELSTNVDPSELPPAQREIIESVDDPVMRETLLDYLQNTAFRSDIFIKGARRTSAARRRQWLGQIGIALTVPRQHATLGELVKDANAAGGFIGPILDLLERGPMSVLDIVEHIGCAPKTIFNIIILLEWHSQGAPFLLNPDPIRKAASWRLNAEIALDAMLNDRYRVLASPLLGTGVAASPLQRLVYHALRHDPYSVNIEAIAHWSCQAIADQRSPQGVPVAAGAEPLPVGNAELPEIRRQVGEILALHQPVWQQLHMI